jgi:hypothetical protein
VGSGELFGFLFAGGAGGTDFDDFGTESGGGALFDFGGVGGHDDDGFSADDAGGVSDSLSVVAAGVSDDAATALVGSELGDFVVGAAQFEAADGLEAFGFDVNFGSGLTRILAGDEEADERGAGGDATDAGLGVAEGSESEERWSRGGGHSFYCGRSYCGPRRACLSAGVAVGNRTALRDF